MKHSRNIHGFLACLFSVSFALLAADSVRGTENGNGVDAPKVVENNGRRVTKFRDERGNVTEIAYFDTNGKPVLFNEGGYHRIVIIEDEHGNRLEHAHFGTDGKPVLRTILQYFRATTTRNEKGEITAETFFGTNNKPMLRIFQDQNDYRTSQTYDDQGNVVEELYVGKDGKPASDSRGFVRVVITYTNKGEVKSKTGYRPDGTAVPIE